MTHQSLRAAVVAPIAAIVFAAGCTRSTPTSPSNGGPLTITCPASMTVPTPAGGSVDVIYPKPKLAGGVAPVVPKCTPTIGATFGLGATNVRCTATDAEQKTASCNFDVTVVVPKLSVTSFVAFGDSITAGVDGKCGPRSFQGDPFEWAQLDLEGILLNLNPPGVAYPAVLQGLLQNRYRLQSPTVINEGKGGEAATGSGTQARLVAALDTHRPDALLLQEGVNDLNGNRSFTAIAGALRTMIREAKGRGLQVFLGTLLPQRVDACREFSADRVAGMNVQIRNLAANEGAALVDLYAAFEGNDSLLDPDGLHPSIAGYAKMAETFFDSIRSRLEEP